MIVLVSVVSMLGFEKPDTPRQRDAQQQSERQLDSVVCVKLHLGQQVAGRDADENAGGKGQRAAYHKTMVVVSQSAEAEIKDDRSQRTHQGERRVDHLTMS